MVEPLVSTQWFVKTKPLAEKAIEAVETGRIDFVPANWTKTYFEWMYNIRDWCISRQLWWGHRIPAWHCGECREIMVAREAPATCAALRLRRNLEQDTDVLDTWFSSGLWPFSTLGWPDQTDDLATFYPTSLLITGFDILFFWVARMTMLGIEFMGDVPFRQVYIHGLVRDAERQKMSKTSGNTIDPLVVTEKYGTDAVRMALLQGAAPGTDIVLTEERMESSRAFANKIWNAARFLFLNMERSGVEPWVPDQPGAFRPEADPVTLAVPIEDRWIFSRLNTCAEQVNRAIETYRYHEAAQVLWHFFWHEFCDWYLELKKLGFQENSGLTPAGATRWRRLKPRCACCIRPCRSSPKSCGSGWPPTARTRPVSIALAAYPQYRQRATDFEAEREIGMLQEIVTLARTLRTESQARSQAAARRRAVFAQRRAGSRRAPRRGHSEAGQRDAGIQGRGRSQSRRRHALHRRIRPGAATFPNRRRKRSANAWTKSATSSTKTSPTSKRQLNDEVSSAKRRPTWSRASARSWRTTRPSCARSTLRYDSKSSAWRSKKTSAPAMSPPRLRARVAAARGRFLAREPLVIAGLELLAEIYDCAAASMNSPAQARWRPLRRWRR